MKAPAVFVSFAIACALPGAQAVASVSLPGSTNSKWASQLAAERFKPTPAVLRVKDAETARHLFPVNDEKGLLLTCVAPEIDKDSETDIFNYCTLAPGRTLDDVMHSFVRGIHEEQRQRVKEGAASEKDKGESTAGKRAEE